MADNPTSQHTASGHLSIWQALQFWLKLGFISFGGPAGQIAIMHQELVERKHWISEQRFLHALNYCMLLPGPEAQQLATYIGWLLHRTPGGILAGGLFVLPSLVLLIVLSWLYVSFGHTPIVHQLLYGIKAAVVAIVIHAAYRIGSRILKHKLLWGIASTSLMITLVFQINFPLMIACAAIIGIIANRINPAIFKSSQHHAATHQQHTPALIDDETPTPKHARFSWKKCITVLLVGAILWFLPIASLVYFVGWDHTYTQLAWFFTKAALLTFGGAYAVLPYVHQHAVHHYHWLTTAQMMDGLALGETTPGPLIIIVSFVGFLAGFHPHVFGADTQLISGIFAACLVTWFTFLPSFIFIFAGAPLIESTRQAFNLSAPLTTISAAVVGVIMSLAAFFAYHTVLPNGFSASVDWLATGLSILALIGLFRFKFSVIKTIVALSILGYVAQLI